MNHYRKHRVSSSIEVLELFADRQFTFEGDLACQRGAVESKLGMSLRDLVHPVPGDSEGKRLFTGVT